MDRSSPTVGELVIRGNIVGSREDMDRAVRVDLGGRCVIPGLTDSHTHFPTWSVLRRWLNLEGSTTPDSTLQEVRAAANTAPPGKWLVGYGWSGEPWRGRAAPPRMALDEVTGKIPTALWSKDMHTFWLNSAGIARAGHDLDRGDDGVDTDDDGQPTGILREAAGWRFRERQLTLSLDEWADAVIEGIALAQARGITAVHDKDGWIGAPEIWDRVRQRGELTLRVWQSVPPERATKYEPLRAASAPGELLRVGYIKVFVDGSLGSGTALMLGGAGVTATTGEELLAIIRGASESGWPVAVHAIGDKANRIALDTFEQTADEWRPRSLRQRVEHAQHLHPDDIGRFANLGITCSVQFADGVLSRDAVDRLPPSLANGSFAFRTLADSGARLVNGSDAPLTDLDPLLGLRAAVLRTLDERPPWRPDQALQAMEALRASTVEPAWLCGEERYRGSLVPGQLADLVVLDRDPVTCAPDELAGIGVVATMVAGGWVHNPPPWD